MPQNPTGGRRLGHVGAVSGRLWIFAAIMSEFGQKRPVAVVIPFR